MFRIDGLRRVNNLPVWLGMAAFLGFLAIIGMVVMQRSEAEHKTKAAAQKVKQPNGAASVLAEAKNQHYIGPPKIPRPKSVSVPVKMPENPNMPPAPPQKVDAKTQTPEEKEAEQIEKQKFQEFQEAVKAKTAVQVNYVQSGNQWSAPVPTGGAASQKLAQAGRGMDGPGFNDPVAGASPDKRAAQNFYNQFASRGDRWRLDSKLEAPRTRYELRAGFVVPAVMISGINSNLPGEVIAQVSENVYDTATGKYLLIPQGSRLVGTYSSSIGYGQERVLVAWQRIVFPDGRALDIGAMPGADSAGYAGFHDKVNNHYLRTFGSAILMSAIIAGVSMSQPNNSNSYNGQVNARDALSEALGQSLGMTMSQMIQKNLNISPTLEIRPGYRFNVMAVKDLVFKRPYMAFDYSQKGGWK